MSGNKITDQDYLYLSSMLAARETRMLSREKAERMISAQSFDDAAKQLADCGYPDMSGKTAPEVEKALAAHRSAVYYELNSLVPEKEIVQAFSIRYDYHNAKVMIKSESANIDAAYLLSDAGRFAPSSLIEAYHADDFRNFPYEFKSALMQAKSVLQRTENPQLADFILDRAYFAELETLSGGLSSLFLRQYVAVLADSANLSSAVRTLRMGKDLEFLRKALVPGGSRGAETIAAAAFSGEGLEPVFKGTVFEQAAAKGAVAAGGGSLTDFELACDNAVASFLKDASYKGFGAATVVAYLAALDSEITAARMILTGKLSGVSPEKLRERLRDSNA